MLKMKWNEKHICTTLSVSLFRLVLPRYYLARLLHLEQAARILRTPAERAPPWPSRRLREAFWCHSEAPWSDFVAQTWRPEGSLAAGWAKATVDYSRLQVENVAYNSLARLDSSLWGARRSPRGGAVGPLRDPLWLPGLKRSFPFHFNSKFPFIANIPLTKTASNPCYFLPRRAFRAQAWNSPDARGGRAGWLRGGRRRRRRRWLAGWLVCDRKWSRSRSRRISNSNSNSNSDPSNSLSSIAEIWNESFANWRDAEKWNSNQNHVRSLSVCRLDYRLAARRRRRASTTCRLTLRGPGE